MHANINDAFYNSLKRLMMPSTQSYQIRGSLVKEIPDFRFGIQDPRKNILMVPYRNNNIFATCAEVLWVLAGRDDLAFLQHFLPRAHEFSDDKKVWRGAYGPRISDVFTRKQMPYQCNYTYSEIDDHQIKEYNPANLLSKNRLPGMMFNQIRNVVKILEKDRYSRQAIITIGQTEDYDNSLNTLDRPCTMFIQFLIRKDENQSEEALHCYVYMRSNDCIWGCFNINVVEWTIVQILIAEALGVNLGTYNHSATSFHIYGRHFERAKKMLDNKMFIYDIEILESNLMVEHPPTKFNNDISAPLRIDLVMNGIAAFCDALMTTTGLGIRDFFGEAKEREIKIFTYIPQLANRFRTVPKIYDFAAITLFYVVMKYGDSKSKKNAMSWLLSGELLYDIYLAMAAIENTNRLFIKEIRKNDPHNEIVKMFDNLLYSIYQKKIEPEQEGANLMKQITTYLNHSEETI